MDIKGNSLLAQMQNMALEANSLSANRAVGLEQTKVNPSSEAFGSVLQQALKSVNELQQDAGAKKQAFELGDDKVTLAETMIASQKAGIAFDATVQVRNKFIEAYKEIMSMPV